MKIQVQKAKAEAFRTEALLLYHFKGEKALLDKTETMDRATHGLIREVIESGDFKGDLYQTSLIYTHGSGPAKRILLVGLGNRREYRFHFHLRVSGLAEYVSPKSL